MLPKLKKLPQECLKYVTQHISLFTTCLLYSWTAILQITNWSRFCHSTQEFPYKPKSGQKKSPNQVPAYKIEQKDRLNNERRGISRWTATTVQSFLSSWQFSLSQNSQMLRNLKIQLVTTKACLLDSVLSQMNPVHIITTCFSKINSDH